MSDEKGVDTFKEGGVDKYGNMPPIPKNLWDKYTARLKQYKKQRDEITDFIKENLKHGVDVGKSDAQAKKDTLLKSGAEKIADFIETKIKIFPDKASWQMMGQQKAVYYVGYLIDQELLALILRFLMKVGMQYEEQVIKLFAWGEGRGAYDLNEKVYSSGNFAGQPLKGVSNRAVKMAEKRCRVDVIISTLGLDFSQDEEYGKEGQLKGDYHYKKDKEAVQNDITELPEESKAVYHAIMMALNTRHNKENIFTNKEKLSHVQKANAIKGKLKDLQDFHDTIKEIAMKRVGEIEGGKNA